MHQSNLGQLKTSTLPPKIIFRASKFSIIGALLSSLTCSSLVLTRMTGNGKVGSTVPGHWGHLVTICLPVRNIQSRCKQWSSPSPTRPCRIIISPVKDSRHIGQISHITHGYCLPFSLQPLQTQCRWVAHTPTRSWVSHKHVAHKFWDT
jgi:hypothetical protein